MVSCHLRVLTQKYVVLKYLMLQIFDGKETLTEI